MEKRDLYDKNRNLTGKTIYKGESIPEGSYIIVVLIYIQNSKGEFLLQKRSARKNGLWATTGGHPKSGEDSIQGILTEVKEDKKSEFSATTKLIIKSILNQEKKIK